MSYSFAVELARSLIRQNTINPPGNEASCAEILAPLLSAAGFTVELVPFAPGRVNLLARIGDCGPGGRALAFTGHLDTVPLGARPWSVDPMGADIDGDRLYGRGSSDMKAGVAAFVAACIDHAEDLSRDSGALLVLTAAEETGCEGARTLVHQGIGGAGALIVAEPTSNYPLVGHKGALWLQAVAQGVTAHGSMPEKGINAVTKAAKAVVQLDDFDFNEKRHPELGSPSLNVGTIKGGMNINSVPDRAEIGLDIRTLPGQRHAKVKANLESFLGSEIATNALVDVEAVWTDPSDRWVRQVFDIMAATLGHAVEVRGAPYFTDASVLTPALGNIPTIILGPGEAAMAHQTDEYCLVSRLDQAVEAYGTIIKSWCR